MAERKSILIIDDSLESLRLLVNVLQREGYHVRPVRDGLRGLATARAESPDLILLDVRMPGIDGYEICRRLKADERTRDIPVIFLGALADTAVKVRGFEAGAVDYVIKPIEEAELLARVNTHLALRALLQNEMKVERHRALARMVAGIAHELNTTLGTSNTAADMIARRLHLPLFDSLSDGEADAGSEIDRMRQAVELLTRNIANAHKLVEDFKKISVNQLTGDPEALELPQLVHEIVDLFRIHARQAKLQIAVENVLGDQDPVWIGYPGYLSQVLINLLANVERYAYADGQGAAWRYGLHMPSWMGSRVLRSQCATGERVSKQSTSLAFSSRSSPPGAWWAEPDSE